VNAPTRGVISGVSDSVEGLFLVMKAYCIHPVSAENRFIPHPLNTLRRRSHSLRAGAPS